jgi:hypothetical protein
MRKTMAPADATRLKSSFLLVGPLPHVLTDEISLPAPPAGSLRLACNVAAHEVTLQQFFSFACVRTQAEQRGSIAPDPLREEARWLWGEVWGTEDFDPGKLCPSELGIKLFNRSYQ